ACALPICVLRLHRIEGRDGRGVPDVGLGEVDDHRRGIAGVVELVDEIVAGGPEQLALHGVAADVDGAVAVDVRLPDLLDADQVRHPAGEQHHGGQYAEHHADGEVAGEHGGDDGDQHDRGLGPG